MTISAYLVLELLDAVFNASAFGLAGNPYVSLHTGDPSTTGANEVTGGSYARVQVGFDAAASGQVANTAQILFSNLPAATITHIGVWDAASAGNFLWGGAATAQIEVALGATYDIDAGGLVVSLT